MKRAVNWVDSSYVRHVRAVSRWDVNYDPGKSHARKLTAAMAMPTPKSTPARIRFEPPSPKANVKPATTIETSESPRAMVVVNACINTLTAFSHGEPPAA